MPGEERAKTRFNRRLHKEGRFEQFIIRREELKRQGVSARDAWRLAGYEFLPLDGSPMEFPPIEPVMIGGGAVTPKVAEPEECSFNGAGYSAADLDNADSSRPETVRESINRHAAQHHADALAGSPAHAGEFGMLVSRMDKVKTASELDVVRWVIHNSLTPPNELDPDEVPSMAAIAILKWVRTSATNMSEFMRIWAKIIPSKSELEVQDRFRDDGRRQFDLLDQFDEQFVNGDTAPPAEPAA